MNATTTTPTNPFPSLPSLTADQWSLIVSLLTLIVVVLTNLGFYWRYLKRPKLEAKVYQSVLASRPTDQGQPERRMIYFQVRNVGKSTASDCRAVLTIPMYDATYRDSFEKTDLPTSSKTEAHLRKNMRLDWFEAALSHEDEAIDLGKSIDMPPDPNTFFLAGTIVVHKVDPRRSNPKVNALVTVTWKQFETERTVEKPTILLDESFNGSPLTVDLTLSWLFGYRRTQKYRYRVKVESYEFVYFTPAH